MTIQVPYLREETIERDAELLLEEFECARDVSLKPPIPIEDIVEKHLKLRIEFDDLHHVLNVPRTGPQADVIGAIWVDRREIFLDESLDPEIYAVMEGRYRFTLAHEGGGHWRLHRPYLEANLAQGALFDAPSIPAVVCRASQNKERIEWQADFYASCLLMPRTMVFEAWHQRFGNYKSRILRRKDRIAFEHISDPDVRGGFEDFERGRDEEALQQFARPFAEQFHVSPIAMRIRLEKLGLLHREIPRQKQFAELA